MGERPTLAELESADAQDAWNHFPAHVLAQENGRVDFYLEYRIQVCELIRRDSFPELGEA